MAGLSDYTAQAILNFQTGRSPFPASASRYLALFTTAPTSDSGTGATEVSGGAYARVQIAGALAAAATWTTSTPNITMGVSNPGWVVAGMNVYDTTSGAQIGTVSSYTGTALVLTANAAAASSGSTDTLQFSAFPAASASSGTEPAVTPSNTVNNAAVTFAQSTASWGTVTSYGIYDALTAGNLLSWDYLGNYKWLPFTCTSASPGVLTSTAHGYSTSDPLVVSTKAVGTLPTTAGSWAGVLTCTVITVDTFSVAVNTTSTGDGLVRKIVQQPIPANAVFIFSASTMTLQAA